MELLAVFIKEQTERSRKAQEEPTERTKQNSKNPLHRQCHCHRNTVTTGKPGLTTGMGIEPPFLHRCKDSKRKPTRAVCLLGNYPHHTPTSPPQSA